MIKNNHNKFYTFHLYLLHMMTPEQVSSAEEGCGISAKAMEKASKCLEFILFYHR